MVCEDTENGVRPNEKDLLWSVRTDHGERPNEKYLLAIELTLIN
jgi:hypothetical protein